MFQGRTIALCAATTALGFCVASAAPAQADDNFNDNAIGSQWTLLEDAPSELFLVEQHQRLEMIATAPTSSHDDALYLSNGSAGFRLSTASDFEITIDYSFTSRTADGGIGTALALDFGVGRDLAGTDSAAVGMGYANLGSVNRVGTVAYRIDDDQTIAAANSAPTSGTFDIAYDAAGDDLTLGITGSSLSYTLADTVQGIWNANSLLVSFGGRGNGFTTTSGDAWLDDFTIVTGQTAPIPEPTTLALVGLGGVALLSRKRRQEWLR